MIAPPEICGQKCGSRGGEGIVSEAVAGDAETADRTRTKKRRCCVALARRFDMFGLQSATPPTASGTHDRQERRKRGRSGPRGEFAIVTGKVRELIGPAKPGLARRRSGERHSVARCCRRLSLPWIRRAKGVGIPWHRVPGMGLRRCRP
jgi:hypothetical protein